MEYNRRGNLENGEIDFLDKNDKTTKSKGIAVIRMILPSIIVLGILYLFTLFLIFNINSKSVNISVTMRNIGRYSSEATSLLGSSSLLSETSRSFILMPLTEDGDVNIGPLVSYSSEVSNSEHKGEVILEHFEGYDVDEVSMAYLAEAAACAAKLRESQFHAISLVNSVYQLPKIPSLSAIRLVPLTATELEMTDEEKLAAAKLLALGTEYGRNKDTISKDINQCVERMNMLAGQEAARTSASVELMRGLLWLVMGAIIVILSLVFIILYRAMIRPLVRASSLIESGEKLNENVGFSEVRRVAASYNSLLKRRKTLEDILRTTAETDALTGLPNRYSFERFVLESGESGYSAAVFLFDINYLKQVNDTYGHAAGDKLIMSAAECISAAFGEGEDCLCARFGGDEFAAIIKNAEPNELSSMVGKFLDGQNEHNISISWGYAYASDIGDTSVKELMHQADAKMYEKKKQMHEREQKIHNNTQSEEG